jgi:hypothetical protein
VAKRSGGEPSIADGFQLVGSGLRTMLNTSAGAGRLEATPKVGGYGCGSA